MFTIRALTINEINNLTEAQIERLNLKEINFLLTKRGEVNPRIQSMLYERIDILEVIEISEQEELKNQVQTFTPDVINDWDEAQIQAIPIVQIQSFSLKQIQDFKPEQIAAFTDRQINYFSKEQALKLNITAGVIYEQRKTEITSKQANEEETLDYNDDASDN